MTRWQLAEELFNPPTSFIFSSYEEYWDIDTVWSLPDDEEDNKCGQEIVCLVVIQVVDHTVRPFVGILHVWHLEARRLKQKVTQTPQRGKRYIHHPVVSHCLQLKIVRATYITNVNFCFVNEYINFFKDIRMGQHNFFFSQVRSNSLKRKIVFLYFD